VSAVHPRSENPGYAYESVSITHFQIFDWLGVQPIISVLCVRYKLMNDKTLHVGYCIDVVI